ncbi:hypothetical protein [Haloarchaeobius sp. DFWS5]|uniref:hypothetical protein n=1 Tax=Haloarchaeobius sp. DFWS5 TaxID=3446114 RepID=UPI003EB8F947
MGPTNAGDLVSFDVDAVVQAASEVADHRLQAVIVYTPEQYRRAFVSPQTMALYDDGTAMRRHFDEVHEFAAGDMTERDIVQNELLPRGGDVVSHVTVMEDVIAVRVMAHREGIFLTLSPDTDVMAVVDAVSALVRDDDRPDADT